MVGLRTRVLQGGQKTHLGLAVLLLSEPDLLLDEPLNHLDIAGREHFEAALLRDHPAAIAVDLERHDRIREAMAIVVQEQR